MIRNPQKSCVQTLKHAFLITLLLPLPLAWVGAETPLDTEFYLNDGANVEVRMLVEDNNKTPWTELHNREGYLQRVSKEVMIASDDISGFTVEEEKLAIHFKLDSWGKILEITRRLKGKRLAFIKDNVILSSPRIFTTLIRSGILDLGRDKAYQEELLKDLPIQTRPMYLGSNEMYLKFQSQWVSVHPNDLEIKEKLANHYIGDKNSLDFKKALPLFEDLADAKPKDRMIQAGLVQCHLALEQYDRALNAGQHALSTLARKDQLFIYALIGETLYAIGEKTKAMQNLAIYLDRLKEFEFLDNDELSMRGHITIDKAIQKVKNRINYMRTH